MTTEATMEKLGLEPTKMNAMRQAVLNQQRLLKRALDKVVRIHLSDEDWEHYQQQTLEFRTSAWTEIYQVSRTVLNEMRQNVGHAHGTLFDTEYDGFEAVSGVLYKGAIFKTITVPVDTVILILGGVLKVIDGTSLALNLAREQHNATFFDYDKIMIPAGEWLTCEILHRLSFVFKFIPTPQRSA